MGSRYFKRPVRITKTLIVDGATEVTGVLTSAGSVELDNVTNTTTSLDSIRLSSKDLSAGNTMLSIRSEGTAYAAGTPSIRGTMAFDYNGTVYYMMLSTGSAD